jgi:hypothetical protein
VSHTFNTAAQAETSETLLSQDGFFNRALAFYADQKQREVQRSEIWLAMEARFYPPIKEALDSADIHRLRTILNSIYRGEYIWGMDQPNQLPQAADSFVNFWSNECVTTAECLGSILRFNSEQPNPLTFSHQQLVEAIEASLGGRLHHPGAGQMPGVKIGDRFIPVKLLESARNYGAARLLLPLNPTAIWEIGSGCGFNAYLFSQLNPSLTYHITDLPIVAIIQAFLLSAALGESSVCFGNEQQDDSRIVIHGAALPQVELSLALNVNSIPEIPRIQAITYLRHASDHLRSGCAFLSVNHESNSGGQARIYDTMREVPSLRSLYRTIAWGRAVYLQEAWIKA